jgi:hypothetical protein
MNRVGVWICVFLCVNGSPASREALSALPAQSCVCCLPALSSAATFDERTYPSINTIGISRLCWNPGVLCQPSCPLHWCRLTP